MSAPAGRERRPLTLKETIFKTVGMVYSKLNYGDWCPEFAEEMVRILGTDGFMEWGKNAGAAQEANTRIFGATNAQLLTGMVAMLNGCTYCGKGHIYAANVHHFKETGELLPLDELAIYWLQRQRDEEILAYLRDAFQGEAHKERLRLLERLYEIKGGHAEPEGEEDHALAGINGAWDWATECTITLKIVDVPVLDNIGKDRKLVAAYNEARAAFREKNPPPEVVDQPWQTTG